MYHLQLLNIIKKTNKVAIIINNQQFTNMVTLRNCTKSTCFIVINLHIAPTTDSSDGSFTSVDVDILCISTLHLTYLDAITTMV